MALIDIFNAFLEFFGNVRSAFPKNSLSSSSILLLSHFFLSKWIFCYHFCTFIYFCLISFFVFVSFNSGLNTSSVTQANTHEQFKYDGKYFHFMHCAVFLSTLFWFFFLFSNFSLLLPNAQMMLRTKCSLKKLLKMVFIFFVAVHFPIVFLFIYFVYWPFVSIFFLIFYFYDFDI